MVLLTITLIHLLFFSELSLKSAKVIITVMFNAIKFADVTRQQLLSAVKKFKLPCGNNTSKEHLAVTLGNTLLEKHVKLNCTDKSNVERANVHKCKVF